MRVIQTNNALKPGGHYSQAIAHNNLLYVSGQLPISPETGEIVAGTMSEQTRLVFENIGLILKEAGSSFDSVLKVVIYISDVEFWGEVNEICGQFFAQHKPVRTIVPTGELHFGVGVEIDCIAVC